MNKIVAYDEMGDFESKTHGICFLGGFVGSIADYKGFITELENELQYLCKEINKTILKEAGYEVVYPASLHMSGIQFFQKKGIGEYMPLNFSKDNKDISYQRSQVINKAEKCINDFLVRKSMKIFCFLDPYTGEYSLANLSASNVGDLSKGANLYEYMIEQSIFDHLFYSLDENVEKVFLEVATRVVGNKGGDLENLYETHEKGFSKVTNTSTIKTAIFTKMRDNIKFDADIVLNVCPANYNLGKSVTMPCLYAADIVCAYLRWKLQGTFGIDVNTVENKVTSQGLLELAQECGIEFRINDDCDQFLNEMVTAVNRCQVVEYFDNMYGLKNSGGVYVEFYETYWVTKLEQFLKESLEKVEYRRTFWGKVPEFMIKIEQMMRSDDTQYEKGLFIAKKMVELLEKMDDYAVQETMLFRLYDIILSGLNHRGETTGVICYIEKCAALVSRVGVEEVLGHSLRVMQYYFNTFDYEKALDAGLVMVEPVNELKKAYLKCAKYSVKLSREISNSSNEIRKIKLPLAGKLFSSIGQAYAFLGQYSNSKRFFLKALDEFEKGSGNERITISHLLQLYIDKGKKLEYELQASQYFGSNNLSAQFKSVLVPQNNPFPLFVYVKAFNKFYAKDALYKDLLKKIINKVDESNGNEHPWELIYANVYEAAIKAGLKKEDYAYLLERASSCVEHASMTIKVIEIGNYIRGNKVQDLTSYSMLIKECFGDLDTDVLSKLEKKLTYMYR